MRPRACSGSREPPLKFRDPCLPINEVRSTRDVGAVPLELSILNYGGRLITCSRRVSLLNCMSSLLEKEEIEVFGRWIVIDASGACIALVGSRVRILLIETNGPSEAFVEGGL
jgi:hypothetical protein